MNNKKFHKEMSYYNYNKILSYAATYNFLVGLRGVGKTYGAKKIAITNAIKKGEQFILLRRYSTELDGRGTFFNDIRHEFPDWELKIHGYLAIGAPTSTVDDKKREWKTLGYFVALSTAQTKKGVSYHEVTMIIFDEFIIERGVYHYLKNEVKAMLDFYSTVDRNKDKTKVFFLANSVSIMNPYFIEYNVEPDKLKEFTLMHDGFIVIHFDDSENFRDEVYQTKFGKFIKGTEYADYAVQNQFKDNNGLLIAYKPSDAKYILTLETINGTFSVWYDYLMSTFYVRSKRPKNENHATLILDNVSTNKMFMERNNRRLQQMRAAFNNGRMFFESASERNSFKEIFRK